MKSILMIYNTENFPINQERLIQPEVFDSDHSYSSRVQRRFDNLWGQCWNISIVLQPIRFVNWYYV